MIEKNNASNAGKRLEKWMKGVCGIGVPRHVSIEAAMESQRSDKDKNARRFRRALMMTQVVKKPAFLFERIAYHQFAGLSLLSASHFAPSATLPAAQFAPSATLPAAHRAPSTAFPAAHLAPSTALPAAHRVASRAN